MASGQSGVLGLAGLAHPGHPTQIYELIAALVFGCVAVWLTPRRGPAGRRVAAGVPFLVLTLGFTLFRVAEYFLRPRSPAATEPS